jgi:hypothetical protein
MIEGGRLLASATIAIWLTNGGVESKDRSITFAELFDFLKGIGAAAVALANHPKLGSAEA